MIQRRYPMRMCALACAAVIVAARASAQEVSPGIELLPGHLIYHENEQEAGVAMALLITPDDERTTELRELCKELGLAAGLGSGNADRLETVFVAPYKGMAIEGYYSPKDGAFEQGARVPGRGITRETLDGIVARAGIPPRVLDQTNVKHEISCKPGEPLWHVGWYDVRPIGDEDPVTVIERAHSRFLAIYQSVVEYNAREVYVHTTQRPIPRD
jgi:hypothetical protein